MAHELNNPLTVITGYAELMTDNEGAIHDQALVILNEARRMKQIIESLIRFRKASPGNREPVSVELLLRDIDRLARHDLEGAHIDLLLRIPEDLARVKADKALATVGLSHKANAFPRALSGGEQQRVAVARAIVGDASVILADEPTAALDSENGQAVMTVLAEIAKDPARATFIVTHDPRIMPFADRILRIEDGRIVNDQRRGANLSAVRTLKYAS